MPYRNPEEAKAHHKEYYKKNRERLLLEAREYAKRNKEKRAHDGRSWRDKNKQHVSEYSHRTEVVERRRFRQRLSKYGRRQKYKDYQKNYRIQNADRIRENKREYEAKRRSSEPIFRIRNSLRARLTIALKAKGIYKARGTLTYVGCATKELKVHLEKQFKTGMSWDNYGEGHAFTGQTCNPYGPQIIAKRATRSRKRKVRKWLRQPQSQYGTRTCARP